MVIPPPKHIQFLLVLEEMGLERPASYPDSEDLFLTLEQLVEKYDATPDDDRSELCGGGCHEAVSDKPLVKIPDPNTGNSSNEGVRLEASVRSTKTVSGTPEQTLLDRSNSDTRDVVVASDNSIIEEFRKWTWGHLTPIGLLAISLGLFSNLPQSLAWAAGIGVPIVWSFALVAAFFAAMYTYQVLAVITIKTPQKRRPYVHVLIALILAAVIPVVIDIGRWGDIVSWGRFLSSPFYWVMGTIAYAETHGFFVMKMVVWGIVVGISTRMFAKNSGQMPFPTYPLRWFALLVPCSFIAGGIARSELERSTPFGNYSLEAYYVGSIAVAYIVFWLSTVSLRKASESSRPH